MMCFAKLWGGGAPRWLSSQRVRFQVGRDVGMTQ